MASEEEKGVKNAASFWRDAELRLIARRCTQVRDRYLEEQDDRGELVC